MSLKCGHQFCRECWRFFIEEKVQAGSTESLAIPCQQDGCNMKVPHSTIVRLFNEKNSIDEELLLKKYLRWHCKSFTDDNKSVKWCPYTKDCQYAVERIDATDLSDSVVNCQCGNSFCFKCG